jgi:uncharacterized membrane protein
LAVTCCLSVGYDERAAGQFTYFSFFLHQNKMKLVFDPIWSWWLVALVVGGLLAMVFLIYPKRVRHLPAFYRRLLIGLRLATVLVLTAAMLRPGIQWRDKDQSSSVFLVLTDASRSTNTKDGPGGITRRQAILKILEESSDQFRELKKNAEVRFYDFAETLTSVESPLDKAEGQQTAIGFVLEKLLEENMGNRILGVLLMSDGAQRVIVNDVEPRAQAQEYGLRGISISTIGFGGAGLSNALDVAVEDLLVDPLVFEKKLVPVSARIRVQGAAGRKLIVRLLVEDRSGKRPGEPGTMKRPSAARRTDSVRQITPANNSEVISVELSYIPQRPGEFKISVEVVPLDDEVKEQNNRKETIITVQKGGINIAYFNRPLSTEQKFLRAMNASDKIQIEFFDIRTGEFQERTRIDPEMFEPDRYDAYIIGDVSANVFGEQNLQLLADRVNEGAGLMMTGGFQSFGPGGYAATPLAELLPVKMRLATARNQADPAFHLTGDLKMLPTDSGLGHFVMRLDSPNSKNRERWMSLAPLRGANRLRPKPGGIVQVLAVSQQQNPLLLYHEIGQSRVMAFAADTTFQWYMAGQRELHQRFWRQVILYLSRKELDTDQQVWVRVDPRNFAPKQLVPLTFGAQDEKGQSISDADFNVEVMNPRGEKQSLTPQQSSSGNSALFADSTVFGDYWVWVSAKKNDNPIGFDGWTRFIVDSRDLEMDNPAANPALLAEIADLSGGTAMPPEELGDFLNRIIEGEGNDDSVFTQLQQTNLWDNWFFLLLFVTLMTAEWFVRKIRGLV